MEYGSASDSVIDISGELDRFHPPPVELTPGMFHSSEDAIAVSKAIQMARLYRCEICYSIPDEPEALRTCSDCGACACRECFANWLSSKIFSGFANAETLCCISCSKEVSHQEVEELCGKRTYRKLLYFLSRAQYRDNKSAIWCSKDGCWLLLSTTEGLFPPQSLFSRKKQKQTVKVLNCEGCVSRLTSIIKLLSLRDQKFDGKKAS